MDGFGFTHENCRSSKCVLDVQSSKLIEVAGTSIDGDSGWLRNRHQFGIVILGSPVREISGYSTNIEKFFD